MIPLDPLSISLRGVQLIEASAGTGKTHTIATLFVRNVLERGLSPDQILVVTFTNAATAELRERIRARLRDAAQAFEPHKTSRDEALAELVRRSPDPSRDRARLEAALLVADEASVHTIHGFCQRALEEQAFEGAVRPGFGLLADIGPLLHEIIHDFWCLRVGTAGRAHVEYLSRTGVTGRTLLQLAFRAIRNREAPVIVDRSTNDMRAVEEYLFRKRRLAEEWATQKGAVSELLLRSITLHRGKYSDAIKARLLAAIDALAASEHDALGAWTDELEKLTPAALAIGTTQGRTTPAHPFFETCAALFEARTRALQALERWSQALLFDFVDIVRRELDARARAQSLRHFDDLLQTLRHALSGPRGRTLAATLRARYPVALIDEFHDTDPVQYEIFSRVYGRRTGPSWPGTSPRGTALFLIGDPKQAIYAFRGADIFAYIGASQSAEGRFTLGTNYRSDPSLITAVNTLFSRPKNPFLIESISFSPVRARPSARDRLSIDGVPRSGLEMLLVRRDRTPSGTAPKSAPREAIPGIVAEDIAATLASGASIDRKPLAPSDIAVLTRTNAEAYEIQRALRRRGIVAVFHGDTSVLDSEEATELARVLRALGNPNSGGDIRAALSTSLLGLGTHELFALGEEEASWERWVSDFSRWNVTWEKRGFLAAARQLMEEHGVNARLLGSAFGERKLTNFTHLVELCHQEASARGLGVAGLLAWFEEVRHDKDARKGMSGDEQQIRLESDRRAVELTTMHRSKGLEYPIVYLPYLWRSSKLFPSDRSQLSYHDPEHGHSLVLDLRAEDEKPEAIERGEEEALAEALRLAYVALTRARHRTVVLWGAFSDWHDSAMARLLHPTLTSIGGLAGATDDVIRKDLEALVQAAPNAVTMRDFVTDRGFPARQDSGNQAALSTARVPRRSLSHTFRTTSFSAMAAKDERASEDPRDVDPSSSEPTRATDATTRVLLDEFPRGPRAGNVLHGILEQVNFTEPDLLEALVHEHLDAAGMDHERWTAPLSEGLRGALRTPLSQREPALALASVTPSQRLVEMEFTFPVADGGPADTSLTARSLARAVAANAAVPRRYLESVEALGFAPLRGFLRGFVDLLFEYQGRFYVVDYKSNHLGSLPADYAAPRLLEPMAEHHYFLQYHLYSVAVHRYLRARIASYDYDRHFGGVFYLFLRGMAPERGPTTGVFFDRPEKTVIESLSDCLRKPGRTAA